MVATLRRFTVLKFISDGILADGIPSMTSFPSSNMNSANVRKMLRILFSLLCIKNIFFWFYRSVGLEANIEYTKKRYYVSHGMEEKHTWPRSKDTQNPNFYQLCFP